MINNATIPTLGGARAILTLSIPNNRVLADQIVSLGGSVKMIDEPVASRRKIQSLSTPVAKTVDDEFDMFTESVEQEHGEYYREYMEHGEYDGDEYDQEYQDELEFGAPTVRAPIFAKSNEPTKMLVLSRKAGRQGVAVIETPAAEVEKKLVPSVWSKDNSARVAEELHQATLNYESSEDELDVEIDDIDMITGNTPVKVNRRIQIQRTTEDILVQHVSVDQSTDAKSSHNIAESRVKLTAIYTKDSASISAYMCKVVSAPAREPGSMAVPVKASIPVKPKTVTVKGKNTFDVLSDDESEVEPEETKAVIAPMDDLFNVSEDAKASIAASLAEESRVEEAAAREAEEKAKEEAESSDEETKVEEPVKEEPENDELRDMVTKRLLAKAASQRKEAEAQRKRQMKQNGKQQLAVKTNPKIVERRKAKKAQQAAAGKQLLIELFGPNKAPKHDTSRANQLEIFNPSIIMAFYSKLLMQNPEQITQCYENPEHRIPIPPINQPHVNVASPVDINIVTSPIITIPLCRNGCECDWYRREAHAQLGMDVPLKYQHAHPCHYLHVDAQAFEVNGAPVVQCVVSGCKAKEHYTPGDDTLIRVIHITPSMETCGHDRRNYCSNVLGDGCGKHHNYLGPLMVSMILRNVLYTAVRDPHQWPLMDNPYMFKASREILETKVPIKTVNETLECRIAKIHKAGHTHVWPIEAGAVAGTLRAPRAPRR